MKRIIDIDWIVLNLIILLPITTLFQAKVPIINKTIFFILIILLSYSLFVSTYKKTTIAFVFGFSIVYMLSFFFTDGVADNPNEYFYMLFFILYANYIVIKGRNIISVINGNRQHIYRVILIWNVCVLVSMFFKSSYRDGYFFSFTGNVFRSATSALFVLSLLIFIVEYNKKTILLSILPLYCIFAGGSRTYLFVGIIVFIMIYYMIVPSEKFFLVSLIPMGIILLIIICNSSIMNKINESLIVSSTDYYKDPLVKFSSGRSIFWKADLMAFFQGSIFHQIFGYGYNFVYDVNKLAINNRIWAHNDYINVLMNYGYIGLGCYVGVFWDMYKECTKVRGLPKWVNFSLIVIWAFNAFFNMFYTYICAVASYPFIVLGIVSFFEKNIVKENDK
mgnify:CR=1 FL=1